MRFSSLSILAAALLLAAICGPVKADSLLGAAKSQYNLFDATPDAMLRRYDADIDGDIRSPHTLDAGHFVMETSLIGFTQIRQSQLFEFDDGSNYFRESQQTLTAGQTWFKVGVTNWADLEFMVGGYVNQHIVEQERDTFTFLQFPPCARTFPATCPAVAVPTTSVSTFSSSFYESGMGDSEARIKINLLGNDGGRFALAVMPFASFPTGSSAVGQGGYRAGVVVPLELNLLRHIQFTFQTEIAHTFSYYGLDTGYSEVLGAGRITYRRWEQLVPYIEASGGGIVGNKPLIFFGPYIPTSTASIGGGVEGKLTPGLILFAHAGTGVTYGSPDYSGQMGIAIRY